MPEAPILRAPWALTPPYDTKDSRLFVGPDESHERSHRRLVALKVDALEPLDRERSC